jgi:hypothetical protein
MKKALIHHFGLIIAIIMNILVYMLNMLFHIVNLSFLNDILGFLWNDAIAFMLRFWILGIITVVMYIYVKNKSWRLKSLLGYYILFIFVFEKTFWMFLFGLAQFLDGFSYNPDIGIAWVVIFPISFMVFVIIGLLFDYIKNKKLKKTKTVNNVAKTKKRNEK